MISFLQNVTEVISVGTLVQLPIAAFLAYQVWALHTAIARMQVQIKTMEAELELRMVRSLPKVDQINHHETRLALIEYRISKESK